MLDRNGDEMKRACIVVVAALGFAAGLPGDSDPVGRASAQEPAVTADQTYYGAVTYLDQGWSVDTANWWYYLSQGTVFVPYEWLLALEQAEGRELFSAPGHMSRLGFLVDPPHPDYNPDGLPVGFAKRELALDQGVYGCWKGNWAGFGCAACHTGQVDYRGHRIRIEGGAAHHDIEAFQRSFGAAINAHASSQPKFARFAGRLLASGVGSSPEALGEAFRCYAGSLARSRSFLEAAQAGASELPTKSGFGRLDAHERGVNLFLAAPIEVARNYVPETAPVSFPAIWDTPYFDWVLYNAAIRQPLARNVIEALGVQAPIDHATIFTDRLVHGVNLDSIARGQRAVMDLTSPPWPEAILGRIDQALATRGEAIYQGRCAACHAVIERTTHAPPGASAYDPDHRIEIPTFALDAIGTDPRQAATFARRTVDLSKIGGPPEISSFKAGEAVTEKIVSQWIAQSTENAKLAEEVNQGRPNEFRGELRYRARPLNGIWATAPYLHNGSVPNLQELLMPAARRSQMLYMGNWDFDPQRVGYETGSPFPGASVLDTRLPGNSNAGHEFGTDLNNADRTALIEYLKTL
jgi:hypothetical protein